MDQREFSERVARWTREAVERPSAYRRRVIAFALLGYLFIFGSVLAMLVVLASIVTIGVMTKTIAYVGKLAVPVIAILGVTIRALWVRLDPPEGLAVSRADAPRLFESIDRCRAGLRAPRIHAVLVDDRYNASAAQVPRLGAFGWQKNYLVLGLPLMAAHTVGEFEAIVAHELGHFAGAHGRLGGWIYRLRSSWFRIAKALESRSERVRSGFVRFAGWYVPRFNALSFVLARAREYEADRSSARLSGARVAGAALTRMECAATPMLNAFWESVQRSAENEPSPPDRVFRDLAPRLRELPADAGDRLERALAETTGDADTHPSLKDRLAGLGVIAALPEPFTVSSAEALLGDALESIESRLSSRWRSTVKSRWTEDYEAATTRRVRLVELEAMRATTEFGDEVAWERACLLSHDRRYAESEVALSELVQRSPDFAPALGALGRVRVARDDEGGLVQIDRALGLSDEDELDNCRAARGFLVRAGREADAQRYAERFNARAELDERDRAERATFSLGDPIEPHELPAEALAVLTRDVESVAGVREAYVVRRRLTARPERPEFVIGLITATWWQPSSARRMLSARDRVLQSVRLPGRWHCLALDGANSAKRAAFIRVAGKSIV